MKRVVVLIVLLCSLHAAIAQEGNAAETGLSNLKSASAEMARLFLAKNYAEYIKFVHPKIVSKMGGKAKMIAILKKTLTDMEAQGVAFIEMRCGEPAAIVSTKTALQTVVPQHIQLKVEGGKLLTTGYLVALSSNNGKTWQFIDTSSKSLDELKENFPDLSNQLVIPAREQPTFIKD
jgi:hypothetical protein